jgi:hypothetical protein
LLNNLENKIIGIHYDSKEQESLLESERRKRALLESECSQLSQQLMASNADLEAMRVLAAANASAPTTDAPPVVQKKRDENVGHRSANAGGGFDCETQTRIAGAGDGGFYLLEYPPTEAQEAIEAELHDLNAVLWVIGKLPLS